MPLDDNRIQLAPQLGHCLCDAVHGQFGSGQCESEVEGVLHLGRLLSHLRLLRVGLDLRDEGLVTGTSRRTVCESQQGVAVDKLRPHGFIPRSAGSWGQCTFAVLGRYGGGR